MFVWFLTERKDMRKTIVTMLLAASMTLTAFASTDYKELISPDDWERVDPEVLDRDELVEAFNALRNTNKATYELYMKYLVESMSKSNSETETEPQVNASTTQWEKQYFVDEFDRPTEDAYITASFDGKFSNSVTSNAALTAKILVSEDKVSIFLYEYGSDLVKSPYSKEYTNKVLILDDAGEKHQLTFYTYSGANRMTTMTDREYYHGYYEEFLDLIQNNQSLSFSITNSMYPSNKYSFTIESVGDFAEKYDEMMQ